MLMSNSWFDIPPSFRLRHTLKNLVLSHRHADCCFIIETDTERKVFPCHKLILSCASDVFDRMLYGDFKESTTGEVKLNEVDPDVFEKFRDYVYGYETEKLRSYDTDTLLKLWDMGSIYLVETLKEDCVIAMTYRRSYLIMRDLLHLFQCAHSLNNKSITERVVSIIRPFLSEPFSHSVVYDFSTEVFKSYIETIRGKLIEPLRFNLIETYIKHNRLDSSAVGSPADSGATAATEEDSSVYISQLLGLIEFSVFTPNQFYEGPGKSNLLTIQQKYEYLFIITKRLAEEETAKLRVVWQ